ncbi:tetratricopeptide repeat protein [Runella sp. CRIBMP]|uniref:tetratricopeptide repeat-containing sensor histidine kinase n=1 Tax=Runella sp. CRIBMP TaxID=2683261 RepID=UPI0014128EA3|nr:sensor histidine kinase [Runella sp. CRIBMP]NBB19242.1 tetratricopeptide repeat protein [Runella sp. CRIBMP]
MPRTCFLSTLLFFVSVIVCVSQQFYIDSLKKMLTFTNREDQKILLMSLLADKFAQKKQADSCFLFAEQALKLAKKYRLKTGEAEALYVLGQGYKIQNNHYLSVANYQKALKICEQLGYFGKEPYTESNLQLKILQGLAGLYDGFQVDSSLYYRMKLLPLTSWFKTHRLEAKITLDIGNSYLNAGDYAKALDYYFKSLELKNKYQLKDLLDEDCHRAIGYLYVTLGDFQKAKPYLFQAKKIKEAIHRGTYYELAHLSNAYEGLSQLDSALYYAKAAIHEALHYQITHELGYIFVTYAKALERLDNYPQALNWYRYGIATCLKQNNRKTLSFAYSEIAKLYHQLGNVDSAGYCARQAIYYARESGYLKGLGEAGGTLAKVYKTHHQLDSALKYQEIMIATKDSLFKQDKAQRIEILEVEQRRQERAKEEAEEKAQQQRKLISISAVLALFVILLFIFFRNRMLTQQNAALQTALLEGQTTERKRVAADLHDALGSTLSSLRWSMGAIDKNKLNMQEQEVYQHVQNSLEQAYDQVRLLSHNLLPEELGKEGLWKTLEGLARKLNRNTPVTFTLQIPENQPRLNAKTEFELYSICLELINNILKHAQATEASVKVEVKSKKLQLTVTDNGKGISEKTTAGKGLRNIAERVESLKGKWEKISDDLPGTKNVIILPLEKSTKPTHA